ncbi:DUF4259 domain-containing protein [Streptomyces uncialis]|uniref:DUF4259 domain-containing protein n=1 Tax=Streptomyces uncialis TaxID=1048205 RepID=UPI0033F41734
MGTWGPGPLDNDTADEYVDILGGEAESIRLATLETTFTEAMTSSRGPRVSVMPEEVIGAAVVVAANTPGGRNLPWNGEYPGIAGWLGGNVPHALVSAAVQALQVTLSADSPHWRGWVDDSVKEEARAAIDELLSALISAGASGETGA